MPALVGNSSSSGKTFESERDILYQVLFDMRQDMAELKRQVNALMGGEIPVAHKTPSYAPTGDLTYVSNASQPIAISTRKAPDDYEYQDTEEYVEEPLSVEEAEKELIRKALIRHRGRRKAAAAELGFSERTLYRKIEKYKLENF